MRWLVALMVVLATPLAAKPILIAHRGASGERPEHTLAAYQLAIEQGADFIEPDLVLTKDGVLVARHENEISETTDVAAHPEFAARRTTKTIDGKAMTGWFTEDFSLAELKTLRGKERLPQLRPANTAYDGQFTIPTFAEILSLMGDHEKRTGRRIGIYPETKHPAYFARIGLPHQAPLLTALAKAKLTKKDSPVFIQSFEIDNLIALSKKTKVRLVQLIAAEGGPADRPGVRYADMISLWGLTEIATYASAIGAEKSLVVRRDAKGALAVDTTLSTDADDAGLDLHVWTMRAENYFLPTDLKRGDDPSAKGDLAAEIREFVRAGVDGIFSDNVAEARAALDQ